MGVDTLPGRFLDFIDPWGNCIEIVGYDNIQFTKAPNVLRGMGLSHLSKNERAIKELIDKGINRVSRTENKRVIWGMWVKRHNAADGRARRRLSRR